MHKLGSFNRVRFGAILKAAKLLLRAILLAPFLIRVIAVVLRGILFKGVPPYGVAWLPVLLDYLFYHREQVPVSIMLRWLMQD